MRKLFFSSILSALALQAQMVPYIVQRHPLEDYRLTFERALEVQLTAHFGREMRDNRRSQVLCLESTLLSKDGRAWEVSARVWREEDRNKTVAGPVMLGAAELETSQGVIDWIAAVFPQRVQDLRGLLAEAER
jgi:hypothetical protein